MISRMYGWEGERKGGREEGTLFNLAVGYFCSYILIYLGHHTIHPYSLHITLPYK